VLGGMRRGGGAEDIDLPLGCEGHEVGRDIYCMLTIG
jgi:hypothetical protein